MKRPNSLRWTVIAVILAAPSWVAAQVARTPEDLSDAREPLEVGNRRQVFIDGRFIDSAQHVELHVHEPRKTGEMNLKPERPWEVGGSVRTAACSKSWHVPHVVPRYGLGAVAHRQGGGGDLLCRSQDGIHWNGRI
jgi:hypothetical protein